MKRRPSPSAATAQLDLWDETNEAKCVPVPSTKAEPQRLPPPPAACATVQEAR